MSERFGLWVAKNQDASRSEQRSTNSDSGGGSDVETRGSGGGQARACAGHASARGGDTAGRSRQPIPASVLANASAGVACSIAFAALSRAGVVFQYRIGALAGCPGSGTWVSTLLFQRSRGSFETRSSASAKRLPRAAAAAPPGCESGAGTTPHIYP